MGSQQRKEHFQPAGAIWVAAAGVLPEMGEDGSEGLPVVP